MCVALMSMSDHFVVFIVFCQSEKEQPVFALLSLRWGSFRDVAASISKSVT